MTETLILICWHHSWYLHHHQYRKHFRKLTQFVHCCLGSCQRRPQQVCWLMLLLHNREHDFLLQSPRRWWQNQSCVGSFARHEPIEKIWAIMKRKVEKILPKSREELISAIQDVWDSIDQKVIDATILHHRNRHVRGHRGRWRNQSRLIKFLFVQQSSVGGISVGSISYVLRMSC